MRGAHARAWPLRNGTAHPTATTSARTRVRQSTSATQWPFVERPLRTWQRGAQGKSTVELRTSALPRGRRASHASRAMHARAATSAAGAGGPRMMSKASLRSCAPKGDASLRWWHPAATAAAAMVPTLASVSLPWRTADSTCLERTSAGCSGHCTLGQESPQKPRSMSSSGNAPPWQSHTCRRRRMGPPRLSGRRSMGHEHLAARRETA